jgi:hypothetical protein
MRIGWQVDADDVARIRAFVDRYRNDAFVQSRIEHNVAHPATSVALDRFWEALVECLLTTWARSGPDSPNARLLRTKPFPLSYAFCASQSDVVNGTLAVLQSFEGIRRYHIISKQLAASCDRLAHGLWGETQDVLATLVNFHAPEAERRAAAFIDEHFAGFGPKQSRNLLQGLGLTQFEIPVDSRIVKWLRDFGFPVPLSAFALSDESYYNLTSDGIQALCQAAGILPCILDAAVFTSYDNGGWTRENVVW